MSNEQTKQQPVMLTNKDVAALMQVSERTIYRWRNEGKMPAPMKIGRLVRWVGDDIHRWIRSEAPDPAKINDYISKPAA